MKKLFLFTYFLFAVMCGLNAQVAINTEGNSPASSAMLDVSSTNKGVLITRMTSAQRKTISAPEMGLLVYDTDKQTIYVFDGIQWKPMMSTTEMGLPLISRGGNGAHRQSCFGSAVDIFGDYAIAGAPFDTVSNVKTGTAYIFVKQNGIWVQQARLKAADGAAFDHFGASVSIYNDIAVVGAPGRDIAGDADRGRAYVFKKTGHAWFQVATLQASDGKANDLFGTSIAIYGQLVIVGAPEVDRNGNTNAGSAYIFGTINNVWSQKQILNALDITAHAKYGFAVDIWGSTVAVGAPFANKDALKDMGAVYVYDNTDGNGINWVHKAKLYQGNGDQSDTEFGFSIALQNNSLIAGAPKFNILSGQTESSGRVFVFERTNGQWGNPYTLTDEVNPSSQTGTAVAIDGNKRYRGAPYGNDSRGAVNIVFPSSTTRSIYDEEREAKRYFGKAIAAHNGQYIIGAPGHEYGSEEGRIYFGTIE